ncbi:MAG: hypothetical protein IH600_01005 [Bacteroidetes bacterium]|nr:hypothetical protein [Bacteroidota bacterium]
MQNWVRFMTSDVRLGRSDMRVAGTSGLIVIGRMLIHDTMTSPLSTAGHERTTGRKQGARVTGSGAAAVGATSTGVSSSVTWDEFEGIAIEFEIAIAPEIAIAIDLRAEGATCCSPGQDRVEVPRSGTETGQPWERSADPIYSPSPERAGQIATDIRAEGATCCSPGQDRVEVPRSGTETGQPWERSADPVYSPSPERAGQIAIELEPINGADRENEKVRRGSALDRENEKVRRGSALDRENESNGEVRIVNGEAVYGSGPHPNGNNKNARRDFMKTTQTLAVGIALLFAIAFGTACREDAAPVSPDPPSAPLDTTSHDFVWEFDTVAIQYSLTQIKQFAPRKFSIMANPACIGHVWLQNV